MGLKCKHGMAPFCFLPITNNYVQDGRRVKVSPGAHFGLSAVGQAPVGEQGLALGCFRGGWLDRVRRSTSTAAPLWEMGAIKEKPWKG